MVSTSRRLDGVRLAAAAFTNLGRDHMDYHPTIEDYMAAKMRLFDTLLPKGSPAVIFADDAWSEQAIKAAIDAGHVVRTVGRKGDYLTLKRVEHFRHKQVAEIHAERQIFEVDIPLAGDFQVSNALVAAGLAMSTGVPAKVRDGSAGEAAGRVRAPRTRRPYQGRRARLCRLCPQAGCAGKCAGIRASVHHRPRHRGVRLRRRP
jgi:UDP-N-acetylmuramyl tripeptide synthase